MLDRKPLTTIQKAFDEKEGWIVREVAIDGAGVTSPVGVVSVRTEITLEEIRALAAAHGFDLVPHGAEGAEKKGDKAHKKAAAEKKTAEKKGDLAPVDAVLKLIAAAESLEELAHIVGTDDRADVIAAAEARAAELEE